MEHLLLKAATTATTDQGTFEAVISTPPSTARRTSSNRGDGRRAAKWAGLGKLVPLAWAHTDEVVGTSTPPACERQNGEVIVTGQVDMAGPRGDETWRLVKSGTLSFSFGYLIPDGGATKRPGGGFASRSSTSSRSASCRSPRPTTTRESVQGRPRRSTRDLISKELQEVKSRLKALEDLAKDAEETPPVKSVVDPLRETAQKLALEIQSGGLGAQPPRSQAGRASPAAPGD
jgi:hypothetical protein